MSLTKPNEREIIQRIQRALPSRAPRSLPVGIGDDAAVLRPTKKKQWVLTCDAFAENVHFLARVHRPGVVGYKSLARAVSDLAAMGATPRYFLLTLALPAHRTGDWLDEFLRGMARLARACGLVLAGGDTLRHATVTVAITAIGEISPGRAVQRSGAKPGDRIYVSGALGGAQLGLELILRGLYKDRRWKKLLQPHLHPVPRLRLGRWLAEKRLASAMIDTSDGLSTDLGHLCQASGTGARIFLSRLPMIRVPLALQQRGFDPLELALHGAEDYELLFSVPRARALQLPTRLQGVPLTCIGEVTAARNIVLVGEDGTEQPLPAQGWDHFRQH
jgi:thiamine-monophosphate kinase